MNLPNIFRISSSISALEIPSRVALRYVVLGWRYSCFLGLDRGSAPNSSLTKYRRLILALTTFLLLLSLDASAQIEKVPPARVPWRLTVVLLDGADRVQAVEIPVKEAVEFIGANSRIDVEFDLIEAKTKHKYTPYVTAANKKAGIARTTRYAMMGWDLPQRFIRSLPVSTSYLFLYKLNGKVPAQAGSALGLDFGLIKGGKPRPYATVPVDMWWYVNSPNQGFKSWAAQILAHEIINTIQAKVEARPFKCGQLTGTPGVAGNIHETERLSKLTPACYSKLEKVGTDLLAEPAKKR